MNRKVAVLLALCLACCAAASVKRAHSCGDSSYLTQDNGTITSHTGYDVQHNYGKNLDCLWQIEAPPGMHVLLYAETFHVEDDPVCSYDSLVLYDGNSTAANTIGTYCGSSFNPVTSSGRFLTLEFMTDDDTQLSGFRLHYNFTTKIIAACGRRQFACANKKCIDASYRCDNDDDCGDDSDEANCKGVTSSCASDEFTCANGNCVDNGWLCDGDDDCNDNSDETPQQCSVSSAGCGQTNLTGATGTVTSPNFPQDYPPNLRCSWYIQAPAGTKTLAFQFDPRFSLEQDSACSFDQVDVHSNGRSFNHGPFCGAVSPGQFTIPGDHAIVEFETDDSDNYEGFSLNWKALE